MGFRNNKTGTPEGLLASRAVIKKGNFALIPLDGLVRNIIPEFENCDVTILSSPKLGATFVDYYVTMLEGGEVRKGFGGEGIETFVYVLSGKTKVTAGEESFELEEGGYVYCPPDKKMYLKNLNNGISELFMYKRKYKYTLGYEPYTVCKNIKDVKGIEYEGMSDVILLDLLPKELNFDMNFHILSFKPGASHGYIETHVQEHGAFILSGQGMYNLDNNWIPVQKGDYIFMGAYSLQAGYGVGKEEFSYLYSKDCHRDEEL